MCRQPLSPPLSSPSAKLMIMALEKYGGFKMFDVDDFVKMFDDIMVNCCKDDFKKWNQSNGNSCTKACADAGKARVETVPGKDYILLPLGTQDPLLSSSLKDYPDAGFKPSGEEEKKDAKDPGKDSEIPSIEEPRINQENDASVNSTNNINIVSPNVNAAIIENNVVDENIVYGCADDPNIPELEDIVNSDNDEDVGTKADMNNLDAFMPVSHTLTTRIHKDHPVDQIIEDLNSAPQTRIMSKNLKEHGLFSSVQQRTNHKDFQNCLFSCFLSQEEPKKLPNGKRAIGTKWVFRNKKDEIGFDDTTESVTPVIHHPHTNGYIIQLRTTLSTQFFGFPRTALSDSASSRSSSNHSLPASPLGTRSSHRLCPLVPSVHHSSTISERPSHDSSSVSHSRKRSRLPVAYVPLYSPNIEALSYVRADLLPSPKRIRSPETATDLEVCSEDRFEPYAPREVGLGVDFEDESSKSSRSRGADLVMDVDVVRSEDDGIDD
ncbi:hypothetical protein Tco_0245917 [Tanacetum coccineum]